ncbi:pyridoxamine 5'-phosphate oxidase family protein [Nocardioides okcheonensis]|uniref:pyridoxamine 5'-phosphate oxidase family protein n=1 Tax=Nocardioides okcheonensis TaxID=2894081 RepID=UPI001E4C5420|nr:pyridoxamine 5'-phosphate oxidase family protein [Nocardioides okcheonensis]UFN42635.1 pyridoxamine 5'-phosphate oxidase family protein [Nocardioides okcheonensis]
MAHDEGAAKVAELVDDARICMMTTMTSDGRHVSRPMGLQEAEFDGDLWFFTYDDSDKARQIAEHDQVNVGFSDQKQSAWTSVSGRAEVVHDRQKAEELWSPMLKAWFPDGLETPGLALIKVHADSAEYWESSSSKVVRLIGLARAAATGDPDKFPATNETVEL